MSRSSGGRLYDSNNNLINPATEEKQDDIVTALGGITSTNNTTTTLLSSGGTYTGTGEQNNYPQVGVYLFSDVAGTLYFDWSVDGTNWHSFPTAGYSVSASIPEFHTAVKLGRYFRVRFVMDTGTQTVFRLTTYYGNGFVPSINPINQNIGSDQDAVVTKSVISGVGNTTATVTDHKALQVTPPPEGKTAFGEQLSAQLSQEIAGTFTYNINALKFVSESNQSGTITQGNSMAVCSTGSAANSSATLYSRNRLRYEAGLGSRARLTTLFTTGVANSTQIAGIGDSSNGFFFGYNGTSFGVMHRKNGSPEIRTLTITTKSSTAENITITLDGDSTGDTVAVTNGANATVTANEIAAHDYSDVGRGWTAKASGNKVIFTSWDSAVHTGTYSLSSATDAVGTFAQSVVGVAPTETWTAQADWNGADKFDGSGLTGVTLDPTKGNIYQISYQWLGFGKITFYIEDPNDGELHEVHGIEYANANTTPSVSNPTLPILISAENTSNTTDIVVKSASMGGFIEGKTELLGNRFGINSSITLGATSTETPFLTIRSKQIYQSKVNTTTAKVLKVGVSADHTKPVEIVFYANPTLVGASFVDYSTNTSGIEYDTSATSFTGGVRLLSIPLGRTGNAVIDFSQDDFAGLLTPGNSLMASIKPKSGNAAEATISVNMVELF